MDKRISEYIEKIEEELEELGVKVEFENGLMTRASGKNVFNTMKVDKATILTAKLEGFKDALKLFEKEK